MKTDYQKTLVADLSRQEGKTVYLTGWVYNLRSSGGICFLLLRDGSGICQCVLNSSFTNKEYFEIFKNLQQENTIEVQGIVKAWKKGFEVQVQKLKNLNSEETAPPYPIGKKEHGIDFLLKHRHLWLRSKNTHAALSIRHEVTQAIHLFFHEKNFLEVAAPILTPNACEGSSTLFSIPFFEEKEPLYLSQSGQFYMEAAAAAFEKVYCFNPVFRAEKSSTRRHLLEFWMVEPEIAFYNLNQCMELAEDLIIFIVKQVLKNRGQELQTLNRNIKPLEKVEKPFPRLHYKEAIKLLQERPNSSIKPHQELGGEEETFLSSQFDKPVFIHHYPIETKAFYMKQDETEKEYSLSFDLLGIEGAGELIGGSERETNLKRLEQRMKEHKVEKEDLEWYLDLRRYGNFPHSGFGLGLERVVTWLTGLNHVREAIAFPRLYGRSFFEKRRSK